MTNIRKEVIDIINAVFDKDKNYNISCNRIIVGYSLSENVGSIKSSIKSRKLNIYYNANSNIKDSFNKRNKIIDKCSYRYKSKCKLNNNYNIDKVIYKCITLTIMIGIIKHLYSFYV